MATFNNPIAYGKRYAAQNVDALNRVGVCAANTTVYNGTLVTLSGMNTGASQGMNYVWTAVPTAANTAADVWMVRSPEVPKDPCGNLYVDPRAFQVEGGTTFDMIRLMPGDIIHVSAQAFGSNQQPNSSNTYVTAAANGQYIAQAAGTGVTGIVFKLVSTEAIPVGSEFVTAYVLEVVQNPNAALA